MVVATMPPSDTAAGQLLRIDSWRLPGAVGVGERTTSDAFIDCDTARPTAAWSLLPSSCDDADLVDAFLGDGRAYEQQGASCSNLRAPAGGVAQLELQQATAARDAAEDPLRDGYAGSLIQRQYDEDWPTLSELIETDGADGAAGAPLYAGYGGALAAHGGAAEEPEEDFAAKRAHEARAKARAALVHAANERDRAVKARGWAESLQGAAHEASAHPVTPQPRLPAPPLAPGSPLFSAGRRSTRRPAPTERGLLALQMEKEFEEPAEKLPTLRASLPPASSRREARAPAANAAKRLSSALGAEATAGKKQRLEGASAVPAAAAAAGGAPVKATDHWVDATGRKCRRGCLNCGLQKTPQWRMGPMGPKTLCNACGVRYRKEVETEMLLKQAEEAAGAGVGELIL